MAYDRHMNLVLGDAEEFRKLPPKKGAKEEVRKTLPGSHKSVQALGSPALASKLQQPPPACTVVSAG
jgi:small nuclear ribonucleoprotein B and B'